MGQVVRCHAGGDSAGRKRIIWHFNSMLTCIACGMFGKLFDWVLSKRQGTILVATFQKI